MKILLYKSSLLLLLIKLMKMLKQSTHILHRYDYKSAPRSQLTLYSRHYKDYLLVSVIVVMCVHISQVQVYKISQFQGTD